MAKRVLNTDQLQVVQAVRPALVNAADAEASVRIGCSGGADSMALTAACAYLVAREFPLLPVEVVVVDHGLQSGSDQIADQVVSRVTNLGLPARSVKAHVEPGSPLGLEAAAREARYHALTSDFDGHLLLAHSLDDQAETVLLGLARGSGTRSLAGMAPQTQLGGVQVIRPLLGISRAALRRAAIAWDLEIWDDPHNESDQFARVRVRRRVLPILSAELGPQVVAALARTAELARADADALDAIADARSPEPLPAALPIEVLIAEPNAVSTRILRRWLIARGAVEPSAQHVAAVMALVSDWRGQAGVDVPAGLRISRRDGALISRRL